MPSATRRIPVQASGTAIGITWLERMTAHTSGYMSMALKSAAAGWGSDYLGYGLSDTNDLFIRTYGGIAGYSFDGLIDKPAVFNRALAPQKSRRCMRRGPKASRPLQWA